MMDNFEYCSLEGNVADPLKIEREPEDEEAEEILPDLLERSVCLKSEFPEAKANSSTNKVISGIKINSSGILLNKTLININGVFYFLEKLPEKIVEKPPVKKPRTYVLPPVQKRPSGESEPCPKCGKILKRKRNLKYHMQVCYNRAVYECRICKYKTQSGHYWMLHNKRCGQTNPESIKIPNIVEKDDFLCVCSLCNETALSFSKICEKCNSLNHWQCKICNAILMTWERARYHSRAQCKPQCYYHCLTCDYKNAMKYCVERHIYKSHPECLPITNFLEKREIPTDANEFEHVCSLCKKVFDDAPGLNRHTSACKKYELYSRAVCEKVMTNKDASQTESPLKLDSKSRKQFMTRYCESCKQDVELEEFGVSLKKSCATCSTILSYKCKKCSTLCSLYDSLVKHVKAVCNKEDQFKCLQCNYIAYSMSQLTDHHRRLHGDISATCTNCGSLFTNSIYFKKHIKQCGLVVKAPRLQCDKCHYNTTTKTSLRKHMKLKHSTVALNGSIDSVKNPLAKICSHVQPYCPECRRCQTTNHRLKFCKVCKNNLQFQCLACNKMHQFDDPDVCDHVKNYLKLLSYDCKNCGKSFSNKDRYELHENRCARNKRYNCELCSYSTKYETYLRLHNRQEHQISNRSKRTLNKETSRDVLNEIEMKIAKVVHLCHYCSYETKTKANLKKHLQMHLEKNEKTNSSSYQKSGKETGTNYKIRGDNKLNWQCKVVLTKLDINNV